MEDSDDEFGLDSETEAAMVKAEAGTGMLDVCIHILIEIQTWTTS